MKSIIILIILSAAGLYFLPPATDATKKATAMLLTRTDGTSLYKNFYRSHLPGGKFAGRRTGIGESRDDDNLQEFVEVENDGDEN